ncbi:MAG: thiamine biosynthesis protein ThiJ [Desulfuromonadales bacterium GWD2_61_12]|nr:MAG: thiamine biosynthesis protein ThiJ [Desulfuromonadales bacterium GWC2_61_20]OGR33703.1 MAG: thiamine biosynthesis protein ThiJ [Desulfuromonadales bacterium GWD2_61_12]HAD04082.1 thiamine biosynthesis protein ThiJ [Desulfuromonas sp.]HBT83729.1 thiamine biosynthesis protein ThiJ [Desulfuromonas sp.]
MKIAFIVYERMNALDFIGVYDPLSRLQSMGFLPDLEWEVCGLRREIPGEKGMLFEVTRVAESLAAYDVIVVPGGPGSRSLLHNEKFITWLRTATLIPLKVSVGSGSLLLGQAGFLIGRRATSHPHAFLELEPFCARVDDARIVDEGEVVTARGVTAAIDLGLHLVRRLAGDEARSRIARQMDYPYADLTDYQ